MQPCAHLISTGCTTARKPTHPANAFHFLKRPAFGQGVQYRAAKGKPGKGTCGVERCHGVPGNTPSTTEPPGAAWLAGAAQKQRPRGTVGWSVVHVHPLCDKLRPISSNAVSPHDGIDQMPQGANWEVGGILPPSPIPRTSAVHSTTTTVLTLLPIQADSQLDHPCPLQPRAGPFTAVAVASRHLKASTQLSRTAALATANPRTPRSQGPKARYSNALSTAQQGKGRAFRPARPVLRKEAPTADSRQGS